MLFGNKIRTVNLSELAKMLGVNRSTLYRWRDDPYLIPVGQLLKIAKISKMTEDEKALFWECF